MSWHRLNEELLKNEKNALKVSFSPFPCLRVKILLAHLQCLPQESFKTSLPIILWRISKVSYERLRLSLSVNFVKDRRTYLMSAEYLLCIISLKMDGLQTRCWPYNSQGVFLHFISHKEVWRYIMLVCTEWYLHLSIPKITQNFDWFFHTNSCFFHWRNILKII